MSSNQYNEDRKRFVDGNLVRQAKRRRWEAKQERLTSAQNKKSQREAWFRENKHFASFVTLDGVKQVKKSNKIHEQIKDTDEKAPLLNRLLRPYFDLQEARSSHFSLSPRKRPMGGSAKPTKEESLFIAEGTETVRLLIEQSSRTNDEKSQSFMPEIQAHSIFVKPSVFFDSPVRLLANVEQAAEAGGKNAGGTLPHGKQTSDETSGPPFYVLVGEEDVMSSVAGFQISRGALACGGIPSVFNDDGSGSSAWLFTYLAQLLKSSTNKEGEHHRHHLRILALDGISDTANLGSMIRCASAFGICAVIMSRDCCDAWYRRSVRVSMGHVFRIPTVRVGNLAKTLQILSQAPFHIKSYAAVIDVGADLILEQVSQGAVPPHWCCVMGNESTGISNGVVEACSHKIRIDMELNVDSLSVPIATGILLHGLKERESTALLVEDQSITQTSR